MTFFVAGVPFLVAALLAGALALVVFAHGPGRLANRALALLLLGEAGFAFGNAMAAFTSADAATLRASAWVHWANAMSTPGFAAVALAVSWPALRAGVPAPFTSLWPYATGWVLFAWLIALFVTVPEGVPRPLLSSTGVVRGMDSVVSLAQWAVVLLLAFEARRAAPGPLREGRILLALGLSLLTVHSWSRNATLIPRWIETLPETGSIGWLSIVFAPIHLIGAGTLAWHVWRTRESHAAQVARWLLPLAAASGLGDALLRADAGSGPLALGAGYEVRLFVWAFWILVPMAILAYVVLSGQVAGLDVKVRFAINRSTLAAAFVAAFFLASEGAQLFFGTGNEWVGLLGAGALVFALAPLQRAAERLAERAVPVGAAPAAPIRARGAELYRRSLRFAMRDGRIVPEEELHLFEVAEELGLTAGEAMRLRQEVERELAGGASG